MNIDPHRALKPGRYVLDPHGKLHPLWRRRGVQPVAIVTVRALRSSATTLVPEPPASAASSAPRRPRKLIDLSTAPSSMEQRAASWSVRP